MFKNKPISAAFLISISVHLFLLFFVTIVVLPANFKIIKPSTVSFLAPILEKAAFEMMLDQKGQPVADQAADSMSSGGILMDSSSPIGTTMVKFENIFEATADTGNVKVTAAVITLVMMFYYRNYFTQEPDLADDPGPYIWVHFDLRPVLVGKFAFFPYNT